MFLFSEYVEFMSNVNNDCIYIVPKKSYRHTVEMQ